MTAYPKHYLADVPHDLRMRVLDLCIRRLWHDALDLLHQNGFTQYEWWEVVWFHDHAPTILQPWSADSLSASAGARPISPNPEPQTESLTLTPSDPEQGTGNPEPSVPPVKPKRRRRPRSKACGLPADVQLTLNTMLAGGCRYRDIIRSLNTSGYPGFNKANLNAWKRTGFQDWLRNQNLPAPEDVQKVRTRCMEAHGRSQKVTEGNLPSSTERKPYE